MALSNFSLDGPAFEHSTRQVTQPDHIMLLQEEAGVDTQIFQPPPGSPAPQEAQGEQAANAPENLLLKCIMEDACDRFHAFQEFEHYSFGASSGSDSDVPEEEGVYPEADQEVIPESQLDVKVQTVATTSAVGGESSSSSRTLMGIHVEPKPSESEDSYELLRESVSGDSIDLNDVNETASKRAIN